MQFQINGQDYFLAFVEDERRWYLFAPKPEGIQRFPVYVDAVKGSAVNPSKSASDALG